MVVADIKLKGKWVSIIDMRPDTTKEEWLKDLKNRWGNDVTSVKIRSSTWKKN